MSLLNKAMDDLEDSRTLYDKMKRVGTDNIRLTNVCYLIQQCIEKALKRSIELVGENPPRTHDIGMLCSMANDALKAGSFDMFQDSIKNHFEELLFQIEERATMYTAWEVTTRYQDGFYEVVRNVDKAYELCDQLVEIVHEMDNAL